MSTYKEITIFYFSGTGNARRIALWISEFANKKNIDCQLIDISKIDIRELEAFNTDRLIIIISPIHGFNFPKITIDFIRHLPKGKNKVVLMNTRAGMKIGSFVTPGLTGVAFLLSSLLLKTKGYRIAGQIPFDMPSNWISIHPALSQKTIKFLHKRNYYLTERVCDKIFSGGTVFTAYKDIIQDILISPISLVYYIAGRFAFAKSYYAGNNCDNCELCIKQCPVKAIEKISNRPFWTFKCESCMKCMSNCPQKAIETAHALFLVTGILTTSIGSYLLYKLFPDNLQFLFIKFIVLNITFFALLTILYKIQQLLLKNRFIRKIISHTSLTYYKFWGRYKSIPDNKWKKDS
ncbi:hypothetical protein CLV62_11141 [Dysgonomonas alginatilytica]|uniref:4Fe-4S binding protein n=1 Tax=Dysgonomonas alginatilytica TaxID=1605892 RepID=A0A2V3PR95_9BACT|nr:EFR1 family ferrodoxin [Dysgonomonas alginatilytica]PXV64083.1 hypothetical protein CLV62_11141 [Dysgonomonas alginatilytica]